MILTKRRFSLVRMVELGALLIVLLSITLSPTGAAPSELIISEYGEGSGFNKYIEIYNGTGVPVDLSPYQVWRVSNGGTWHEATIDLSGTLGDGQVLVVHNPGTSSNPVNTTIATAGDLQLSTSTLSHNGDDAIGLAKNGALIDAVGEDGADPGSGWDVAGITNATANHVLVRKDSVCTPNTNWTVSRGTNSTDSEWVVLANEDWSNIGTHTTNCNGGEVNAPVSVTCGGWLRTYETGGGTREISASDPDGTVISLSISIDPIPGTGAITLENFVPARIVGDTATGNVVVGTDVPEGVYEVSVTAVNDDGTPQEAECSFNVDVDPFLTIGEVQGEVLDTDNGTWHDSPYEDEWVAIQGVIYAKTQQFRSSGGAYYGFFIQNTADTDDDNPLSSDGIFVFHNRFPTLRTDTSGVFYFPEVGDEVILRGPIDEYFGFTEMVSPYMMKLVREEIDIESELPPFETDPNDDLADANRYWERREGMRAQIPADSIVLNGRDVFASSFDAEVWVARPDSTIALRTDPFQRRAFRDVHPLDDIPWEQFDNDNGYRILIGSLGIKEAEDDTTAMVAPSRTYDTVVNAPIGGVYYAFGKYSIQVGEQITLANGVNPSTNNPPSAPDSDVEYSVVVFNVENLYDFRDDPFDGCDFIGNSGCPGVNPPFNYVPSSDAAYQGRLEELAAQIINDLHSPDIILAQEAEDQDICWFDGAVFACDSVNNADGKPDTLQELAAVIAGMGGPIYDAAFDRDGADDRGIVSGYLFRADRVELLPPTADNPVLGSSPAVYYPDGAALPYNTDVQNPKALNAVLPPYVTGSTDGDNVFTRPPQVALLRIWRGSVGTSVFQDVYVSNNHFSSGPDRRVDQRTEQAKYNAAIVEALQAADPEVYAAVGGDLNVYPRPDDPFPTPNESDQLAGLYNVPMTNLWNIMVSQDPASAYSYIYQGQTQTLDQMFLLPGWFSELTQARMAHINADFPADYTGDGPRGTSDHDPVLSAYSLYPTLDRLFDLLMYYDDMGYITGNNTFKILLDHLEKAERYLEKGNHVAYEAQLQAFSNQVQGFAPQFVTQETADFLSFETAMLLSMP